jgi:hypothetical protein
MPFAQLTDLHLKSVGAVHRRIADAVNARRPAFVLLTGDSIDRADRLPVLDAGVGTLRARLVPRRRAPAVRVARHRDDGRSHPAGLAARGGVLPDVGVAGVVARTTLRPG